MRWRGFADVVRYLAKSPGFSYGVDSMFETEIEKASQVEENTEDAVY